MKNLFFLIIFGAIQFAFSTFADTTCVHAPGFSEISYLRPTLANIEETTHFIIHWESPTTQDYTQNTAAYAEYAYQKMCTEMGWLVPPPDDNRGGDNRYDIYLVNPSVIQGYNGITQPETPGNWIYEWSPSFVLIRNNIETDDQLRMIVAHEFNHASQCAYSWKDGSMDTWFLENTAVWIAEIVYNYAYNYYLHYFDGADPLDHPEYGIHAPEADIGRYDYAGFLWPKFLAEWTGDITIIKKIWQRLGSNPGDNILPDIDFVLSQPEYESSLNEAAKYYAEWRYFTGDRDDGLHFANANDLPTCSLYSEPTDLKILGFGGTFFISCPINEEIVEILFDGVDDVNWSANVLEHKFEPPSIFKNMSLNSLNQGSIEAITEDCQDIIFTPVLLSDISKKSFTYTENQIDARKIYFYNMKGASVADGNLKLDDITIIPSGDYKWMRYNSTPHIIKTLNERYDDTPIYKHNNWNNTANKFMLSNDFTVQQYDLDQNANFVTLKTVTVRNLIDGMSFNDGVPIQFNDPWYVKDENDTQSGMGDFITFNSPYFPTGKYNQETGGVFLNQGEQWQPPYYSVAAISPQPITTNGRTHTFYFQNWSSDFINGEPSAEFQDSMALQTGVVFKEENAVVKANMKGTQLSNNQSAYANSSQRKFVKDWGENLWKVYESLGQIWLEKNDELMNGGRPVNDLSQGPEAKSPCLDYYFSDMHPNEIYITYQQKTPDGKYKIMLAKFNELGQIVYNLDVFTSQRDYASFDAAPVIAVTRTTAYSDNKPKFCIVWRQQTESEYQDGLYYWGGVDNGTTVTWYYEPPKKLLTTDSQSSNPTIAVRKNPGGYLTHHVAWQQGYTKIKESTFLEGGFDWPL